MRETLYDYCERMGETELLRQWHPSRSGCPVCWEGQDMLGPVPYRPW